MTGNIRRAAVMVALAGGAAVAAATPAYAGQANQAPGFASSNGSCVGAGLDFMAHYGTDGDSWPTISHGAVGPSISGYAVTGGVGAFESNLAQDHGDIGTCVP